MASKATASKDHKPPAGVGTHADDVDKIRNIIFGDQMREYAGRFDQMERDIESTVERLSKRLEDRFGKLERSIASKLEQLQSKLAKEAEKRKDEDTAVNQRMVELQALIDQAAAASKNELSTGVEELTAALATQDKDLGKLIEKTRAELSRLMETEASRLERNKVSSKDLSQLFTELSRGLKRNGK